MLHKLASNAGAQISYGCRVISVDPELPCVTTSTGEEIRADLIVGADGDRSIVRKILEEDDEEEDEKSYTSHL